jgi:signal transduction histidine kinase
MKNGIVLITLLITGSCFSQKQGQSLLDSLKGELPHTINAIAKTSIYLRISDVYIDIDLNQALVYADSADVIARKIKWQEGIAKSQLNYGNVYNFRGDYHRAMEYIQKSYELYKSLGIKKEVAHALYTLGMSYERLSNYPEASRCYFESLRLYEILPDNDRQTGNSLSAIAVIYFLQKDYQKSLEYSARALQKQESAKNFAGVGNELTEMADTYLNLHDSSHAAEYNLKALNVFIQLGDKTGQATVYHQLGQVHARNEQLALAYLFKAKKLYDETGDSSLLYAINMGEIGRVYLGLLKKEQFIKKANTDSLLPVNKQQMYRQAEDYLQKAVIESKRAGDLDNESKFSADLATLQALKGDYQNAFLNYKLYHETQESIFSQDSKNKIAALETQREVSLKNKEIENKELQISNQNKKMGLLLSGIAFLCIIGFLLFRQNRISKKTNSQLTKLNSELAEANTVKAKFFGILSHDLRSPVANLLQFLQLRKRKPGLMTEEQILEREAKIAASATTLLETMETMLLWSKGQMNYFKPEISRFPVSDLFLHLEKYFSETPGVQFIFSDPQNLVIQSDLNYLQTIMHNLSANAVQALKNTPDARIEWKAWRENELTCLSVTDNGPGVQAKQITALYDETAGNGARQGLGLHIIRDLAKAINCKISLKENNGKGTTFILIL